MRIVPARFPVRGGRFGTLLRRALSSSIQSRLFRRRVVQAARRTGASIFYPLARRDLDAAVAAAGGTGAVFRPPGWGSPTPRDIAQLAPDEQRWSMSPTGPGYPLHLTVPTGRGSMPEGCRHAGRRITLVYRGAVTSPGRYLQTSLERAGVVVDYCEDIVDYASVSATTDAVVIVESLYPPFEVVGSKPDVPTLFWVHHGEHHLQANVRLAARYGADGVLLAHSWHLAHRFPVPVHRFPFAVAPEISGPGRSFDEREFDVAMVAAGLEDVGGTYTRRQQMVSALRDAFPDRSHFVYGLHPEDLADLYRNTRVVPNEGGQSHQPITMRVFEAVGNGARLLAEPVPGLNCLFKPGIHYIEMGSDPVADTHRILSDPSSSAAAAATYAFAMEHHTYDHRVDELFKIVDSSSSSSEVVVSSESDGIIAMIEADPDVQVVIDFGNNDLQRSLPTREIRDGTEIGDRFRPRSVDAVVVGPVVSRDMGDVVSPSRSYVYAIGDAVEPCIAYVLDTFPSAQVTQRGDVSRIDLGLMGYRRRQGDHPLA